LAFASRWTLPKASNAIVMLTLQAIGIKSSQQLILVPQSQEMEGLVFISLPHHVGL
jgi:hypothetical protein